MTMLASRRALLGGRPRPALPPRAVIGEGCLTRAGITCEACREVCPAAAIRFRPGLRRIAEPALLTERCTGCGGCLPVCPAAAITLGAGDAA